MSSRWGAPHQPPVSSNDTRGGGGDRDYSRRNDRGYQQDGMRARAVSKLSSAVILNLSYIDTR